MLEIKNLDPLIKQLDRWEAEVYEMTRRVFVGLTLKAFKSLVTGSAQFSGDFAANWKYSINAPDLSFQEALFDTRPKSSVIGEYGELTGLNPHRKAGDGEAVRYAFSQARGTPEKVALGDVVYLSNSAHHEEPYAWKIEDGKIKFRPGNRGETRQRALDALRHYEIIDRNKAIYLSREKL